MENEAPRTKPKNPRPSGRGPVNLRPLPMRISERTYKRLEALRNLDDMTLQEHVRRGLEYYLDHIEVSIALSASEALKSGMAVVRQSYDEKTNMVKHEIVPDLLMKHAPAPRRTPAPRVIAK